MHRTHQRTDLLFVRRVCAASVIAGVLFAAAMSAALAAETYVYTISTNQDYLNKYKASDGSRVWQVQSSYTPEGTAEKLPLTYVTAYRNDVYVVYGNSYLGKLRAKDGSQVWVVPAGGEADSGTVVISAAEGATYLIRAGQPFISKFMAKDGKRAYRIASSYVEAPAGAAPTHVSAVDADLYVIYGGRWVAKLQASDGERQWAVDSRVAIDGSPARLKAIAAATDGCYVISDSANWVRKYSRSDGTEVWQAPSPCGEAGEKPAHVAAYGKSIYVTCASKQLAKLRSSNGTVEWVVPTSYAGG